MLVADAGRGMPWAAASKQLLGLEDLDATTTVVPVEGADAGMVGMAFDYRLRYHLGPCRGEDLVAFTGARVLGGLNPNWYPALEQFFFNLAGLTAGRGLAGKTLDDRHEQLLAAYCVVLAQLESVYRTGGRWVPQPPLSTPHVLTPEDEPLLALAPPAAVEDVVKLSRSASAAFGQLIEPVASGDLTYDANPNFAGSVDIGGADADFIIGDTIFELKTTKSFTAAAIREALLQLLGYVLLDYDDDHEIRRVGVYFARQEWVAAWPLWLLMFPPAEVARLSAAGLEPSDRDVTDRLAKLRTLMNRAVKGETIDLAQAFS